jgi:uncharacterized membrane protein YfcA
MNLEVIFIGAFVGLLVGLTGVGGGSIMTPLLIIALRVNPLIAVGTDLLYSVPTKLLGAYLHGRQGTVNGHVVRALCWGGIPAAIVGVALLYVLRHHADVKVVEFWTRRAIGASLVLSAAIIVARPFLHKKVESSAQFEWRKEYRLRAVAIGAAVGLIVTITSIGSGSVTLPLLTLVLPSVGLAELVGSDVAFAAVLIPAAAIGHWSMGDVNLRLALNLLLGSLPGVYVGSKLCGVLTQRWLRPAVAVTLLFAGSRLI